jgi:hypothetical protein
MWTLKSLIETSSSNTVEIGGKWVPCRPINYQYRSLKEKFQEAYAVFSGKAEPFTWPEGQ